MVGDLSLGVPEWRAAGKTSQAEALSRCGSDWMIQGGTGVLAQWVEDGRDVEPYGVEISAALADLARRRCPQWADRIWTANALGWQPPRTFDLVRTGLDYVPESRRPDLVRHLLEHVVAPGGRLLVGVTNERRGRPGLADALRGCWGFRVAGGVTSDHPHDAVVRTVHWLDREPGGPRK